MSFYTCAFLLDRSERIKSFGLRKSRRSFHSDTRIIIACSQILLFFVFAMTQSAIASCREGEEFLVHVKTAFEHVRPRARDEIPQQKPKYGTGFIIERNANLPIILTAGHVVHNGSPDFNRNIFIKLACEGRDRWHEVRSIDERYDSATGLDYAILKPKNEIADPSFKRVRSVKQPRHDLGRKRRFDIIGYRAVGSDQAKPFTDLSVSDDRVSAYRVAFSIKQVSTYGSEQKSGLSGAPVLNKYDEVVGIVINQINKKRNAPVEFARITGEILRAVDKHYATTIGEESTEANFDHPIANHIAAAAGGGFLYLPASNNNTISPVGRVIKRRYNRERQKTEALPVCKKFNDEMKPEPINPTPQPALTIFKSNNQDDYEKSIEFIVDGFGENGPIPLPIKSELLNNSNNKKITISFLKPTVHYVPSIWLNGDYVNWSKGCYKKNIEPLIKDGALSEKLEIITRSLSVNGVIVEIGGQDAQKVAGELTSMGVGQILESKAVNPNYVKFKLASAKDRHIGFAPDHSVSDLGSVVISSDAEDDVLTKYNYSIGSLRAYEDIDASRIMDNSLTEISDYDTRSHGSEVELLVSQID